MSRPARCKATTPNSTGHRPSGSQNELRLWYAVILRAIADLQSHDELIRKQARYWFSVETDTGPGSFVWCCDMLGKNPDAIRNKTESIEYRKPDKNRVTKPCEWPHGCTEQSQYGRKWCTWHYHTIRRRQGRGWDRSRWFEPVRKIKRMN